MSHGEGNDGSSGSGTTTRKISEICSGSRDDWAQSQYDMAPGTGREISKTSPAWQQKRSVETQRSDSLDGGTLAIEGGQMATDL